MREGAVQKKFLINRSSSKPFFFHFSKKLRSKTFTRVGYLNKIQLRLRFRKSLDLEIPSSVGYFKKKIAFLIYAICFHVTVHNNRCLHKRVRQTENGLERGFVLNTG